MTIERLPTFWDEIQPGIQQLTQALPRILNPHYDQQLTLKKKLAEDPAFAQKLIDMGPDQVKKVYGKGALRLYDSSGEKSAGRRTEEMLRAKLAESGKDPAFIEEYIGNLTGTKTTKERRVQDIGITNAETQGRIGLQTEEGNKLEIKTKKEDEGRVLRGRLANVQVRQQYGAGASLFELKRAGKIQPEQLQDMLSVPEIQKQYDNDQADYWQQQHLNVQKQQEDRLAGEGSDDKIWKQRQAIVAGSIADKYGVANPKLIYDLYQDPKLLASFQKMKESPTDESQKAYWEAAQAIKQHSSNRGIEDIRKAKAAFFKETAADFANLRRRGVPPDLQLQSRNNINSKAVEYFSGYTEDIPQWVTDKTAPGSERSVLPDRTTTHRVGGDDSLFGVLDTDFGKPSGKGKETKIETPKPNEDAKIIEGWKSFPADQRQRAVDSIKDHAMRNKTIAVLKKNGLL